MNRLQEKTAAVIYKNDLSDLEPATEQALHAPVPDQRALELRTTLLAILSRLAAAAASASPSPRNSPPQPPQLDPKLIDEFNQWQKEYNAWVKGAAKTYAAAP